MKKVETLIIGSGVVAAALSKRLLEKNPNMSILILEAGSRWKTKDFGVWTDWVATGNDPIAPNSGNPMYDHAYPDRNNYIWGENASVGQTQMPLEGGRAMVYGGSTVVWGGWSLRRKPEDFYLYTNTGQGLDWLFNYDELEPYYCQSEDYLAVSGDSKDELPVMWRSQPYPFHAFPYQLQDQPVGEALQSLGYNYMHMPIARRGVSNIPSRHAQCQTTGTCDYCPFGARFAACDYMDDFRQWNDLPNFDVRLGAVVLELRMSSKRRVAGVTYRDTASGEIVEVDADRVIVAAGTLESPKLLLRSKSRYWQNGVGNDTDNVGRYLITHPYVLYSGELAKNPLRLQPEMDFPTLMTRYFDSPEEQAKGKYVLVNISPSVELSYSSMMQAGWTRKEIDKAIPGPWPFQIHSMIEIFGEHKNHISNLERLSHLGMHQSRVDFTAPSTYNDRVAEVGNVVASVMEKMGGKMTSYMTSWRCDHAASTCRMSKDPKDGVVDGDLRVHGVDNLYVCSNAVFPNLGAINPTVTVTAIAFRLGDHLNSAA
ncbi:MAG TPA: GMC family oxidoreductase [Thermoanaerobaculia bacterium]|jgi:choline dehydrogenase-like flavoprotein